jgi:hypothetical protein
MLREIVSEALVGEPAMRVIGSTSTFAGLGPYTRRKRIDVLIFVAGDKAFEDIAIADMLRVNPRLCLLGVDGQENQAIVHFLSPSRTVLPNLEASTLASAIRAGTGLRLG